LLEGSAGAGGRHRAECLGKTAVAGQCRHSEVNELDWNIDHLKRKPDNRGFIPSQIFQTAGNKYARPRFSTVEAIKHNEA
jgi:hypothetical protein